MYGAMEINIHRMTHYLCLKKKRKKLHIRTSINKQSKNVDAHLHKFKQSPEH